MKTLRLWWKWRKAKRREYPLRYVGPTITLRGVTITYGTPLAEVPGPRGTLGARRYVAPDNIIRLLSTRQVEGR